MPLDPNLDRILAKKLSLTDDKTHLSYRAD